MPIFAVETRPLCRDTPHQVGRTPFEFAASCPWEIISATREGCIEGCKSNRRRLAATRYKDVRVSSTAGSLPPTVAATRHR